MEYITGTPNSNILGTSIFYNNDICDCERCPCCGKLRKRQQPYIKYNSTHETKSI